MHQLQDHLKRNLQTEENALVHNVKQEMEKQGLLERILESNVFPKTRFLNNHNLLPFRATRDNLVLASRSSDVVVSYDQDMLNVDGVSFASCVPAPRGPFWTLVCYVATVEDMYLHLKYHLQQREYFLTAQGQPIFQIVFPLSLSTVYVKDKLFPNLRLNAAYGDTPRETLVICEYPLPQNV